MPEISALIERLRESDPDRLTLALLAPPAARERLVTLYALNDELARTALAAREPMVAEMRIQWWVDQLTAMAERAPPPHELLSPIWSAWGTEAADLASLAEARVHDARREPFQSAAEVIAYAEATGGALMHHAAKAVGLPETDIARIQGRGAALIAWLRARPALQPLSLGLAKPTPASVQYLAKVAAKSFAQAAAERRHISRNAASILFPGVGVAAALKVALTGRDPTAPSDFARRAALARLALTGRWWI